MNKKKVKWRAFFLLCLLCFLPAFSAAGAGQVQEPLFFAGEDEINGYRYEAPGIGSLSANVKEGEAASVVVLTVDGPGSYYLYQDGNRKRYKGGDILYEAGDYELYLYPLDTEQRYAKFTFQIQNDFENLEEELKPGKTVINPELSIGYDKNINMYSYTLPNGSGFWLSVPLGGISDQPVTVRLMDGSYVFLAYCNGEAEAIPEDMIFTRQGQYRMTVESIASMAGKRDNNLYKIDIYFTIGTSAVNQMELLNAPTGFLVDAVTCNGRSLKPDGEEFIRLKADGIYHAVFADRENPETVWQMKFNRDTSPPCLIFNQPMNGGRLDSPVAYTVPEAGCSVTVKFNGILIPAANRSFSEGGYYEVVAKDIAGNERIYSFYIENRYPLADRRMIIIFAAIFTAAAAYLAYCRKNMQIL